MSHNSSGKIDQKEYLKKYLSGDKTKKKKKKKDKKHKRDSHSKVRIIDDDATAFKFGVDSDDELMLTGEDAPQIVGEYLDTERMSNGEKWRSIGVKEEVQIKKERSPDDLWGKKAGRSPKIKKEYSPQRKRRDITPDLSPPRKRGKEYQAPHGRSASNDLSPNRKRKRNSIEIKRRQSSSDQSPPRRAYGRLNASPHRIRRNSRSPQRRHDMRDQSPPRQRQQSNLSTFKKPNRNSADFSPDRRRRNSRSPPTRWESRESDQSPRRRAHNPFAKKDSRDLSPTRRKTNWQQNDLSPQRRSKSPRRQQDFNFRKPDLSPPRRHRNSQSPGMRRGSADQSPARRRRNPFANRAAEERNSPQRARNFSPQQSGANHNNFTRNMQRRNGRDNTPQQQQAREFDRNRVGSRSQDRSSAGRWQRPNGNDNHNKNTYEQNRVRSPGRRRDLNDYSPPRRPQQRSISLSPERIKHEKTTIHWETAASVAQRKQRQNVSESPPPTHKPKATKTLDGKKAGLQDAQSLRTETLSRRREEDRMYEKMSNDISGRDAEVQVRSTGRRGQRARDARAEDPEKQRLREEHEQVKKERYDRWGKGLKQVEEHRERLAEQQYESSKPLARYSNDEDLERHLRDQERADDPMLDYMRRKKKEKQKNSNAPQVPIYEGNYPENRYGIRPGYRWDGVDRSNGYEKKWFDAQNERRALRDEAYKYSVEDM